jgi:hypothetical protein
LHDLVYGEVVRMTRLQVRRDEAGAHFELLQRNAGLDAGSLDGAVAGDAVVAVERAQESGFAGAVGAVDDPAVAFVYFKGKAFEDFVFVQIDGGVL